MKCNNLNHIVYKYLQRLNYPCFFILYCNKIFLLQTITNKNFLSQIMLNSSPTTIKNIDTNNIVAKSSSALKSFVNLSLSFNTFSKCFTEQKHEPGILITYLCFYLLLMYFRRHDAKTQYL